MRNLSSEQASKQLHLPCMFITPWTENKIEFGPDFIKLNCLIVAKLSVVTADLQYCSLRRDMYGGKCIYCLLRFSAPTAHTG